MRPPRDLATRKTMAAGAALVLALATRRAVVMTTTAPVLALFPIVFVVSAALNPLGTLSSSRLVPTAPRWTTCRLLRDTSNARWFGNSMLIAGLAAVAAVFVSTMAAYAFSNPITTAPRPTSPHSPRAG